MLSGNSFASFLILQFGTNALKGNMVLMTVSIADINFISDYTDWLHQIRVTLVKKAHLQESWKWNEGNEFWYIFWSYLHVWMTTIGNPFAYQLHLFCRSCASQRVKTIGRSAFLPYDAVSHISCRFRTTEIWKMIFFRIFPML